MKNPWIVIGVIVVLLIGGSVWYSSQVGSANNDGVTINEHIKGNPAATVTLVEYSDFQCPACGQFQPVLADIMATYGDSLRFEYKHLPLTQIHPFAEPAARAAEAAGQQGKFFEYHDLLFANQATWSKSAAPAAAFTAFAEELGLDLDLFAKHQRSSLLRNKVRDEFDAARALGLTGTPSFFLNGQPMKFNSYEEFKAQIAAAINPTADFNLDAAAAPLQMIEVEPEVATTTGTADASAPVVEFSL